MLKRYYKITIFWIVLSVIYAVLTISAISALYGYSFNWQSRTWSASSIISIESKLDSVTVLLNGERKADKTPVRLMGLKSGAYTLEITKDGYYPFVQQYNFRGGEVEIVSEINLVSNNPRVTTRESDSTAPPLVQNFDVGLTVLHGELLDWGNYVTRFSVAPLSAHRFNGGYLYFNGSSLRLYFPKQRLDLLVYESQNEFSYSYKANNWVVEVYDQNKVYEITFN